MIIGWRNFCLVAFALAFHAGLVAAQQYSQFRGQDGSGRITGQQIPLEWSEEKNVAWKIKVPGSGWSQPVLWNDRLYVTSAVSDPELRPKDFAGGVRMPQSMGLGGSSPAPDIQIQWKVFCFQVSDGQQLWEHKVFEGKPEYPVHPSNTYATETPVVDENGVYVFFGATGEVAAMAHDGSVRWKSNIGAFPTNNGFGTGSSVAIDNGLIFIQHFTEKSSYLICFQTLSGERVWQRQREKMGSSWSSPILWRNAQRTELIVSGGELLESVDPRSGQDFWRVGNVKAPTACSVASDSNRIYFGGSDPLSKGPLFAVRPGSAGDVSPETTNETFEYCDWLEKRAAPGMASPVSSGKYVMIVNNSLFRAYDCETGKKIEEKRLSLNSVAASPILIDQRLLVLDESGKGLLVDCTEGFPVVGEGQLEDIFWSTPAVSGNSIYFRGVDSLYCVRSAGG